MGETGKTDKTGGTEIRREGGRDRHRPRVASATKNMSIILRCSAVSRK